MAVSVLGALAASARAPVFVVEGRGARPPLRRLLLDPRLEVVASPRHATVLLVAGAVPADHAAALRRIHDQLPHPRGTVWWTGAPLDRTAAGTLPGTVEVTDRVAATVVGLHRDLVRGDRPTSPAQGPDQNPTAWRGVGPHGQGGEGMMGGSPYGRSMAMTGADVRDGLELDRVALTLGPYHAALPPGLTLDLELQGDVIVSCAVRRAGAPWIGTPPDGDDPTADDRLMWLADLLRVHGLGAWSQRVLRVALEGEVGAAAVTRRARRLLIPSLAGVGTIAGEDALGRLDRRLRGDQDPSPADPAELLTEHLPGTEWAEAVTTIWSLDPQPLAERSGTPT